MACRVDDAAGFLMQSSNLVSVQLAVRCHTLSLKSPQFLGTPVATKNNLGMKHHGHAR